jgi:hypothetical protein
MSCAIEKLLLSAEFPRSDQSAPDRSTWWLDDIALRGVAASELLFHLIKHLLDEGAMRRRAMAVGFQPVDLENK